MNMIILMKIALRNIIKNWKKSLLIVAAIFISCLIFLISNALSNGAEEQIISGYISNHSGHIMLLWKSAHDTNPDSPERLYASKFDPDKEIAYKLTQNRLNEFLTSHTQDVKSFFHA